MVEASETVEFYSPFAHIPNRLETCRIHCPDYGSFDTCIVIAESTDRPVTVYVASTAGASFMADRFPQSACIRLPDGSLILGSADAGRHVTLHLAAQQGPIREANLTFQAVTPERRWHEAYGSPEFPVWGGEFYCRGVDLNLAARATGALSVSGDHAPLPPGRVDTEAIVTLGSVGILGPLH